MLCRHCAEVEGEGKYCDECGKPLREGGSGTPASSSQPTTALGVATKPALATAPMGLASLAVDARPFQHAKYNKKWNNVRTAISSWNQLVRGLDVSPTDFYRAVRIAIERRRVPDVDLALVEIPEGGVFSAKREYLRILRKDLLFDICAAPFGDGFFVSTWLGPRLSGWRRFVYAIPVVNVIYFKWLSPDTYYRADTTSMFLTSIHSAVLEVLDRMMEAKGIRVLSEDQRKPIHRDFFQR